MSERSRHQHEFDLFTRAQAVPRTERGAWLRVECGADETLYSRVTRLLEAQSDSVDFTEITRHLPLPKPGDVLNDRYTLQEAIGEGGYGVVYRALDHPRGSAEGGHSDREVAVKVLKPGLDSRRVRRRFETEQVILGQLRHPSIAVFFDRGITDRGLPYFVMEYIHGCPITEFAETRQLSLRDRLALFLEVCDGVQHAHSKGCIHRDLSPANILVEDLERDGTRSVNSQPRIIDFGLARTLDSGLERSSSLSQDHSPRGTRPYASPEQILGRAADARSDVYSLGAILFELMTGVSAPELATEPRTHSERPKDRVAPRPSSILKAMRDKYSAGNSDSPPTKGVPDQHAIPQLQSDLDWLILRCLELDPDRRYSTVAELAAELRRFLRNEPLLVSPPSFRYQTAKFVRRHRAPVLGGVAVIIVLIAATTVSSWLALVATRAERVARLAETKARDSESIARRLLAQRDSAVEALQALTTFQSSVLTTLTSAGFGTRLRGQLLQNTTARLAPLELTDASMRNELDLVDRVLSVNDLSGATYATIKAIIFTRAEEQGLDGLPPLPRARLFSAMGRASLVSGDPQDAVKYLEAAASLDAQLDTVPLSDTFETLSSLASALYATGRLDRAHEIRTSLIESLIATLGPDDPRTIEELGRLAQSLVGLGHFDRAAPLLRQMLESARRSRGEDSPLAHRARLRLATLLRSMGEFDEAHDLLDAVLASSWGSDPNNQWHVTALMSMARLKADLASDIHATPEDRARLRQEAIEHARRASSLSTRAHGAYHPDSLDAVALTLVLHAREGDRTIFADGKVLSIEDVYRRAILRAREGGTSLRSTRIALENDFAALLATDGHYPEALAYAHSALEESLLQYGERHFVTIGLYAFVLELRSDVGDTESAAEIANTVHSRFGDPSPDTDDLSLSVISSIAAFWRDAARHGITPEADSRAKGWMEYLEARESGE